MSSFKFPPPPPPPPKASPAPNNDQQSYSSQRGGHPRGSRGTGFGGRHGDNLRGGARGGYGSHGRRSQASAQPPGSSRGGHQHGRGGFRQQNPPQGYNAQYQSHTHQSSGASSVSGGGYVNPEFVNQAQTGAQAQAQMDPTALAQAMAFITTPAGMQSFTAFANQMAGGGLAQSPQSPPPNNPPSVIHSSSPQNSRKRKRSERGSNWPPPQPQPKQKPPKAKAIPAPAVPSFGLALPGSQDAKPPGPHDVGKSQDQKRTKINLGLTSRDEGFSDNDSDEEIDEEARYAKFKGMKGVVFEHEGQQISLQTAAEVAAWIKDRKRQYPTQKRIKEKEKEAAERRQGELAFLRKVKGRSTKQDAKSKSSTSASQLSSSERGEKSEQKHQKELERLRKKLHLSMLEKQNLNAQRGSAQAVKKPQITDLGLGYDSETESDEGESSELEDSSVVSSSQDPSEESDSDSDSDSDDSDAAPEEQSSKVEVPSIKTDVSIIGSPTVPEAPAPTTASKSGPDKGRPARTCDSWTKYGKCNMGRRCRFAHPPKEEQKPPSLYEKLVEQELKKADQRALEAIKYLGRNGFLG